MNDLPETIKPRTRLRDHTPGGLKLTGLITVLLIVLKLCGVRPLAGWTWLWILSPFWILGGLAIIILLGMFVIFFFFDR